MVPDQHLQCFVDCTETICSGINTGIQRTVRNIVGRQKLVSKAYDIELIPVVALNGRFYRYDVHADRKIFAPFLSRVFGSIRDLLDRLCYGKKVNVDVLSPVPMYSELPARVVSENVGLRPSEGGGHLRLIEFCRKIIPFFFRCAFYLDHAFVSMKEADISPHDIIFYPDAFWCRSTYLSFSRYQAVKILLLHDIIPLTMPEACEHVYVISFRNTLARVLNRVDGVITISRSELTKIKSFLADNGDYGVSLLDYNYWGADFAVKECDHAGISSRLTKLFAACPFFIMVGTVEPRKNHAFVLDAFERFWEQGGEASLCIIGKVSMLCSNLKMRIDNHEYLGIRLFLYQNVDDAELVNFYKQCAGVIFASLAEGFGLPLVEAMWYGCPVLASDIAVFREIGDDYPYYFLPHEPQSLIVQLKACLDKSSNSRRSKQWISWDDSVKKLFGKVIDMAEKARHQRMSA